MKGKNQLITNIKITDLGFFDRFNPNHAVFGALFFVPEIPRRYRIRFTPKADFVTPGETFNKKPVLTEIRFAIFPINPGIALFNEGFIEGLTIDID